MGTGTPGTFVISWAQTEIDGLRGAPVSALEPGALWRWQGEAVRVDGSSQIMALDGALGQEELHERAARAARRMFGVSLPPVRPQRGCGFDESDEGQSFAVTDGRQAYQVTLIDVAEIARPLLMFAGRMPPRGADLWIARGIDAEPRLNRITDSPTGVICFTPGTRLRTPEGDRLVEELVEGDRIETKDGGAQDIVWIGARRMSGARLFAMPELRPVRIRSGALGKVTRAAT